MGQGAHYVGQLSQLLYKKKKKNSDNEVIKRTTIDSTLIIEKSIREGVEGLVCSVL